MFDNLSMKYCIFRVGRFFYLYILIKFLKYKVIKFFKMCLLVFLVVY